MVKPFLSEITRFFFFSLFSTITITVNRVAKIMRSAHLCVIFHVKHKKSPILILGKIQDGGQDDDH